VRILWKLKQKMIGSGLSYEIRVIRSVNRLHINNLGPSGIGGLRRNFGKFNMKTMNIYIYVKKISLFSVNIRVLFFISK